MKGIWTRGVVGVALAGACTLVQAFPSNGDFSDGLNHWTTQGNVIEVDEQAVLGDAGASHSMIYQGLPWNLKLLVLELDIRNLLSDHAGPGLFKDGFFASLYFTDDLAAFDLDNQVYDRVVSLFDMDAEGVYNSSGMLTDSPKGPDWQRFTASIDNQHAYAIPVFELYDLNQTGGDSLVFIDNVTIVPEPGVGVLFGVGMTLLLGFARSRQKTDRARGLTDRATEL